MFIYKEYSFLIGIWKEKDPCCKLPPLHLRKKHGNVPSNYLVSGRQGKGASTHSLSGHV
jgi:hypothetical protein